MFHRLHVTTDNQRVMLKSKVSAHQGIKGINTPSERLAFINKRTRERIEILWLVGSWDDA
jgi:hypothetical protein